MCWLRVFFLVWAWIFQPERGYFVILIYFFLLFIVLIFVCWLSIDSRRLGRYFLQSFPILFILFYRWQKLDSLYWKSYCEIMFCFYFHWFYHGVPLKHLPFKTDRRPHGRRWGKRKQNTTTRGRGKDQYQYFFRVEIFLQVSNGKVFIMVKIKMIELMTMANNGKSEGGRYFV